MWRERKTEHKPSWPRSVQIPGLLPRWAPAILVSSLPRVLALGVFFPLQTAGSQAPPISFLLSSNVSVSMKPVLSKYLTWQTYPLPVSFLGHSHQLAGWLVRLLFTLSFTAAPELHKGEL